MSLSTALLVYAIVAVLIFVLARISNIRTFSAIVLALVVAQITMSILRPDAKSTSCPEMDVYLIIQVITSIVVLVYVFGKALSDR